MSPIYAEAQTAPFCPAGRAPSFSLGFAALDAQLGNTMGDPLECEHPNYANGDVLQQTTTGLAYWRPSTNISVFTTDGTQHWALASVGLRHWQNGSAEPPQPRSAQGSYLMTTADPLVGQVDALLAQLGSIEQQASAGNLHDVPVEDVGNAVDDLATARDSFASVDPLIELTSFHQAMLDTTDTTSEAATTLLRAQLTQNTVARNAFVAQAASQIATAIEARATASDAYSLVLPVGG